MNEGDDDVADLVDSMDNDGSDDPADDLNDDEERVEEEEDDDEEGRGEGDSASVCIAASGLLITAALFFL